MPSKSSSWTSAKFMAEINKVKNVSKFHSSTNALPIKCVHHGISLGHIAIVEKKQGNKYEWTGREVNNTNLRKRRILCIVFFSCKGANIFELNSI